MIASDDPRDSLPTVPTDVVTAAQLPPDADLNSLPLPGPPQLPTVPPITRPLFLLIDDEKSYLDAVEAFHGATELHKHAQLDTWHYQHDTEPALSSHIAERLKAPPGIDALVVDLNLRGSGGDSGGLDLIQRLRKVCPELTYIPAVIMTAAADPDRQALAFDQQVEDYVIKVEGGRADSNAIVGGLLSHRLIIDLPHWRQQAEERFWLDLNKEVSEHLSAQLDVYEVCRLVGKKLETHFRACAVCIRERSDGLLYLLGGSDRLQIGARPVREKDLPYIEKLLNAPSAGLVTRFDRLADADVGSGVGKAALGLRALVAVLRMGRETLGYLVIYRNMEAPPFRRLDEGLAGLLAQQLSAALYGRRRVEALESRQKRLAEALDAFARAEGERDILRELSHALHDTLNTRPGSPIGKTTVRSLKPGTDELQRFADPLGMKAPLHASRVVTLRDAENWTVARAAAEGKPFRRGDLAADTPGHTATAPGIRSNLTVPIKSQDVLVGVANLESQLPFAYTDGDEAFSVSLCGSAADAMIRIRSQRFALGIATELNALVSSSGRRSSDNLLATAVQLLFDYTGYAELLYLVRSPDDQPWEVRRVFGRKGVALSDVRLDSWRQDTNKNWAKTFVAVVIAQDAGEVRYTNKADEIAIDDQPRSDGTRSRAEAVLLLRPAAREPASAALVLLFMHPEALSRAQLDMLDRFGRLLGGLLERQVRIGQLMDANAIAQQNARLGEGFHFQRHAMRNKLVAIRNLARDLGKPGKDPLEIQADILERVSAADRDVARGRNLVKVPEPRQVRLEDIWEKLRAEYASLASQANTTILSGDFTVPAVYTDPDVLEAILGLLVENAVLHAGGSSGRSVTVRARSRAIRGKVAIAIADDGKGLARTVREKLFEPGITTKSDSTGVGLFLSHGRARELGGELSLLDSDQRGTAFELLLPIRVSGDGR